MNPKFCQRCKREINGEDGTDFGEKINPNLSWNCPLNKERINKHSKPPKHCRYKFEEMMRRYTPWYSRVWSWILKKIGL